MKKTEVYFVDPDLHADNYGITGMEAPWTEYRDPWVVVSDHDEEPIGQLHVGAQIMTLVDDMVRRVVGVENKTTGKVRWIAINRASGLSDIKTQVPLPSFRESGLAQDTTLLSRMLQHPVSRARKPFINEQIIARGGNPKHRSIFKPTFTPKGRMITHK